MNQRELMRIISKKTGKSVIHIEGIVDILSETVLEVLENEKKVSITRLGTFKLKERKERMGYDPYHEKTIEIPARKRVEFEANKHFKERLKHTRII